jgi:hypothetical protein
MRRVRAAGIGAALSCVLCTGLAAQAVELRLYEDSSRVPIPGAIVRLLRAEQPVAQGLTNELGRLLLRAPGAGEYRLKVDRIGFLGFTTPSFPLLAGETLVSEIPVVSRPMELPTIVVGGRSRCGLPAEEGAAAAALWDEVRKALTANLITQGQGAVPLHVRIFERQTNRSGRVLQEWTSASLVTRQQPFRSVPPAELARLGFVYGDRDTTIYNAPDAELLLADAFVSSHCFRAVAGARDAGLVGLAFEPTSDRRERLGAALVDVSGTLWVDRATSELRFLEYRYTGLPTGALDGAELGGRVEFRRLVGGAWVVAYWHIRMPWLELTEIRGPRMGGVPGARNEVARLVGFVERGGRTAVASDSAVLLHHALLRGVVYDSTTGRGLDGAIVHLGPRDSLLTGGDGSYAIRTGGFGPQRVTVRHPKLGLLRDQPTREIVLSLGDSTRADFAVPSLATFVRSLCGNRRQTALVGLALDRDARPAVGMEVQASWRTSSGSARSERARPDVRGLYALCNLPPDQTLNLSLVQGGRAVLEMAVRLEFAESRWLDLRPASIAAPPSLAPVAGARH